MPIESFAHRVIEAKCPPNHRRQTGLARPTQGAWERSFRGSTPGVKVRSRRIRERKQTQSERIVAVTCSIVRREQRSRSEMQQMLRWRAAATSPSQSGKQWESHDALLPTVQALSDAGQDHSG